MANNKIRIKRRKLGDSASPPPANDNSFKWGEIAYNETGDVLYYGGGSGDLNQDNANRIVPIAGSGQYVLRDGSNATGVWAGVIEEQNQIDSQIQATSTIGGISIGTTYASGTSITSILSSLLEVIKHPTVQSPYVTISNVTFGSSIDNNANIEVGTTGVLSARLNYYQGYINGNGNCVTWNTNVAQTGAGGVVLYRAGVTSSISFDGQSTSTTLSNANYANVNTTFNSSKFIVDNANTINGNATYNTGNAALDCKGNISTEISPNPLTAGTTSNTSFTINGRRKYFYDYKTDGILPIANSANIRALTNSVLATSSNNFNGGQLSITVPQYAKSIVVAYPSSWGDISIVDIASNLSLVSSVSSNDGYYKTVVSVYGLNNLSAINYNVYHYTPAFFANEAIHIITKI